MSKYQARHYVATAKILRKHWAKAEELAHAGTLDTITKIADDFAREFHTDSPAFDSVRFWDAVHTGKGI